MISFYNIAQKYLGIVNCSYPLQITYFENYYKTRTCQNATTNQVDYLMCYYIYKICSEISETIYYTNNNINNNIYTKYKSLDPLVMDNMFVNQIMRDQFMNLFCKIQKTYFAFSKFAKLYRYKKANIKNKEDLSMNPIEEKENNKTCIKIYQSNSFFLFKISELINMFNSCLVNTEFFFPKPLKSKNPYNNVEFNISTLYYIYFSIKASTFIMPTFFHLYFLCDFDLNKFKNKYEVYILNVAIKNFVYNTHYEELYQEILIMLKNNNHVYKLQINRDFPKQQLVEIMRPYLHLYYRYLYSTENTDILDNINNRLWKKFKFFYEYNKQFGRKIVRVGKVLNTQTNQIENKVIITFNDKHINFHDI
jgi:hypothetical protein